MSTAWFAQRERSSTFWLKVIIWIARHLGRRVARGLLYPITGYFVISSPATRKASRNFLQRVLDHPPGWQDVYRHHHCFASVILDRVFLLAGRESLLDIQVEGYEMALEQLAKGRGAILLGSHLGSFEALRVLGMYDAGLSLKVLMIVEHNQMITRMLNLLNPEVARTVIPVGQPDTFLRVKEALDQGELVGMLGDRVVDREKQLRCDFLGETAGFPTGPMQLAVALKVPVIMFYGIYEGGNRYRVYFELLTPGFQGPREERQAAIQELVCRYARHLEAKARMAPYNWFNFYDYWRP
ncbi:LpxL/LpxP family acyltransferase [Thiolapillus sp.]